MAFNTHLGVPTQMGEIKGAGWAIAYESDVTKIQPEDFVMISTNQSAPYWRETIYGFPAGLPPCPQGGCHCAWVWIHSPVGGGQEMYMTGYRCMVMNADPNAKPLAKPQVARKCPYDKNNCTIGAKQPHYWYQQERNNNFQDAMGESSFRPGCRNRRPVDLYATWLTTRSRPSLLQPRVWPV